MATTLRGQQRGKAGRLERTKDGYVFTENRIYVVLSDNKYDNPGTVALTNGLPLPGITITTNGARCRSVDPVQDPKNSYVWIVKADFSTEPLNQQTPGDNPNPTSWIPIYTGAIETVQEVMYFDRSVPPKPYLNSAGDKFPEPLIRKKPVIVYEFDQYEDGSVTDVQIGDRNDTTNSSGFKGFATRTLRLNVTKFTRGWYFNYECVKVSYRAAYNKDTWLNKPVDVGYEYRLSSGERVKSPKVVFLNTDGTKKADTAPPDALEFKELPEINFSSFLRT